MINRSSGARTVEGGGQAIGRRCGKLNQASTSTHIYRCEDVADGGIEVGHLPLQLLEGENLEGKHRSTHSAGCLTIAHGPPMDCKSSHTYVLR